MKQFPRLFTVLIMLSMILGLFSMPAFGSNYVALAQDETPAAPAVESTAAEPQDTGDIAPLYVAEEGKEIPGQYIVVFKDEIGDVPQVNAAVAEATAQGAEVQFVYTSAIKGFAAHLTPEMVTALRNDPRVAFIEADQIVTVDDEEGPSAQDVQDVSAIWGLDRIDQMIGVDSEYTYPDTAGEGVHVYVLDTGIRTTHQEFGTRATQDYSAIADTLEGDPSCSAHGTHVAATIGGETYGVAKKVTLHSVRVLGCNGSGQTSWVLAGIDWVRLNHIKPAVANMSLGGGASLVEDNAVKAAIAKGVTFAVAAGNSDDNACYYSPARASTAITVGATDIADARAVFSNFGACVDIFAPGVAITSAINDSDTATDTWDGTSMASPHVAGAAALYLAGNPTASPAAVTAFLIAQSGKNRVIDPLGSPNRLLFVTNKIASAPVLLTPALNSLTNNKTPTLTWKPLFNAETYDIEYTPDPRFAEANVTKINGVSDPTYPISPALPTDGRWYWRVRGVNAYLELGPWSAARYFTLDSTAPAAPALKLPVATTPVLGTPTFIWYTSVGAVNYQFAIASSSGAFPAGVVAEPDTLTLEQYSPALKTYYYKPTTPISLGTHYWSVRAKDLAGNWGLWQAERELVVNAPNPGVPVLKTPASNFFSDTDSPTLEWNPVAYAVTYDVQIDTTATFALPLTDEILSVAATSTVPNSVLPEGKYYWRVHSVNTSGTSLWSAARYFTVDLTPPAVPTLRLPLDPATVNGTPIFYWNKALGATQYKLVVNLTSPTIGAQNYESPWTAALGLKPPLALEGAGTWHVISKDAAGHVASSATRTIAINPLKPGTPVLSAPANGTQTDNSQTINLVWSDPVYATTFEIQIDNASNFSSVDYTYPQPANTGSYSLGAEAPLPTGRWYWRVRALNSANVPGAWSVARYFTILPSFDDDFTTDTEGWVSHFGDFSQAADALHTNGLPNGYTASASHPATFTNFTYSARVKMTNAAVAHNGNQYADGYYGLVVRGTPTLDYFHDWRASSYYFEIDQHQYQYLGNETTPLVHTDTKACYNIWRNVGGRAYSVLPYGLSWCSNVILYNDWNNLKVVANGTSLGFYINDNLMWKGVSASPLSGRLGVYSYYYDFNDGTAPLDVDWAVATEPNLSLLNEQVLPGQWTSSRSPIVKGER